LPESADQASRVARLGVGWTKAGVKAKHGVALLEELFSEPHDFFIRGERHIISVQPCRGRLIMF
jgi:hypothetical protein